MNKRKLCTILGTVSLLAVVAVGTTMALLHATTETVENTFSSNKKISISLREPKWDGYVFADKDTVDIPDEEVPLSDTIATADSTYPKGASTKSEDETLGIYVASTYLPGDTIPKNPIVLNTSEDEPVYVAATIECLDANQASVPYETTVAGQKGFKDTYGTITFTDAWVPVGMKGNAMVYLYGSKTADGFKATPLAQGKVTEKAVFQSVKLNLTVGDDGTMPTFHVQVKAYAIQAANIADKDAAGYLKEFIGAE